MKRNEKKREQERIIFRMCTAVKWHPSSIQKNIYDFKVIDTEEVYWKTDTSVGVLTVN